MRATSENRAMCESEEPIAVNIAEIMPAHEGQATEDHLGNRREVGGEEPGAERRRRNRKKNCQSPWERLRF